MQEAHRTAHLNDYEVIKELGKGSYGVVYQVRHCPSDTLFVMKTIPFKNMKSKEQKAAFREVSLLRSLQHPNIIKYENSFLDGQNLYIVMQYAERGDLYTLIRTKKERKQQFTEPEIWRMASQLVHALAYLHSRRIIHRDIKTLNVFVTADGTLKLGDLGVSKVLEAEVFEQTRIGTPLYLAPELVKHETYDFKADIWSLGIILYLITSLDHPFSGKNIITLGQSIVMDAPKPLPPYVSVHLKKLIIDMLEKKPLLRPDCERLIRDYSQLDPIHYSKNNISRNESSTQGIFALHKQIIATESTKTAKNILDKEKILSTYSRNPVLSKTVYCAEGCQRVLTSPDKVRQDIVKIVDPQKAAEIKLTGIYISTQSAKIDKYTHVGGREPQSIGKSINNFTLASEISEQSSPPKLKQDSKNEGISSRDLNVQGHPGKNRYQNEDSNQIAKTTRRPFSAAVVCRRNKSHKTAYIVPGKPQLNRSQMMDSNHDLSCDRQDIISAKDPSDQMATAADGFKQKEGKNQIGITLKELLKTKNLMNNLTRNIVQADVSSSQKQTTNLIQMASQQLHSGSANHLSDPAQKPCSFFPQPVNSPKLGYRGYVFIGENNASASRQLSRPQTAVKKPYGFASSQVCSQLNISKGMTMVARNRSKHNTQLGGSTMEVRQEKPEFIFMSSKNRKDIVVGSMNSNLNMGVVRSPNQKRSMFAIYSHQSNCNND